MNASRLLKEKSWAELDAENSWQIFKVMGEFVKGFETLNSIGPCVSIFGSARTKPTNKYYKYATQIAKKLTEKGYGIITGGGPGIMEAANKGAFLGDGRSVGLNITLPHEQHYNKFIDYDKVINFDYFFVRKVMFVKYAQGFVVMPGGFGTMDEFFEAITLMQTEKISLFPVVLFSTEYWKGLIDWIHSTMFAEGNVSQEDLDRFTIVDTVDAAVDYIDNFYAESDLSPNF